MPEKLNNFSSLIVPSILKILLSVATITAFSALLFLGFYHFKIPGSGVLMFLSAIFTLEHIYRRIGTAEQNAGQIGFFDFRTDFFAKTTILYLIHSAVIFGASLISFLLMDQYKGLMFAIILKFAFGAWIFITNAILISYAVQGTSLGEGISAGMRYCTRHFISNIAFAVLLAGLSIIPFAGSVFFIIAFIIIEYFRTYWFINELNENDDDARGLYYDEE